MNAELERQRREFIEEFKREHGDDVRQILMAKLFGEEVAFARAGLRRPPAEAELWGLLLLGEKLHFYAPAKESAVMSMFRTDRGATPKPQYACFSDLPHFSVKVPERKGFMGFFMPRNDLEISFGGCAGVADAAGEGLRGSGAACDGGEALSNGTSGKDGTTRTSDTRCGKGTTNGGGASCKDGGKNADTEQLTSERLFATVNAKAEAVTALLKPYEH